MISRKMVCHCIKFIVFLRYLSFRAYTRQTVQISLILADNRANRKLRASIRLSISPDVVLVLWRALQIELFVVFSIICSSGGEMYRYCRRLVIIHNLRKYFPIIRHKRQVFSIVPFTASDLDRHLKESSSFVAHL